MASDKSGSGLMTLHDLGALGELTCEVDAIDRASTSASDIITNPFDFFPLVKAKDFLDYTIVGYFLGRYPHGATNGIGALCTSCKLTSKVYFHPSGLIVFHFLEKEDGDAFLSMAPHMVNGCPINLLELTGSTEFSPTEMTKVSVWVRLPGLDLDCWTLKTLSRIAVQIGRLISIDKSTRTRVRTSYARLFIEVDLSDELVHSTKVKHPTKGIIDQHVVYEELPKFCKKCVKYGHTWEDCLFRKPFIAPEVPSVRKKEPTSIREAIEALNAERRKEEAEAIAMAMANLESSGVDG